MTWAGCTASRVRRPGCCRCRWFGLILAASLVLLHEARNGRDALGLARLMLWLGIGATVGANIAYGAGFGLLGALISAWPAVAFIGAVEMVMQLVRRARGPRLAPAGSAVPAVPGEVEQAVRVAYATSVTAGAPLSQRAMASRFRVSRRKVSQLITPAAVHPNGRTGRQGAGVIMNRHGAEVPHHRYRVPRKRK
jgi:hypothetical protein